MSGAQSRQEPSGSVSRSPQPYASLTQIRAYLAHRTQQVSAADGLQRWLPMLSCYTRHDMLHHDHVPT